MADPYRWLEDPNSKETAEFVKAQNALSNEILASLETRKSLRDLMEKLYNYPKYGTPFKRGDHYFYYFNSGLQQHYVLYTQPSLDAEAEVVLDPNTFSTDGTVALKSIHFTEDAQLLAYSTSSGGSDWEEIQVLSRGEDGKYAPLEDKLKHVKFSCLSWTHDNKGFFYNRYPMPEGVSDLGTETDTSENQQLCYHVLGQPQSSDAVVWAMPELPEWMSSAEVTDDGRYVLLYLSKGCLPSNKVYLLDLSAVPSDPATGAKDFRPNDFFTGSAPLPLARLVDNLDASYNYVANEGSLFYFQTNLQAPRYRLVKVDVAKEALTWIDVVPEHPKDLLQSVVALKGDLVVTRYLRDVCSVLELRRLSDGQLLHTFELPGLGSVRAVSATRKDTELLFSFQSFVDPGSTFVCDAAAQPPTVRLLRRPQLAVEHNPDDYVTRQEFVRSRDGTLVPMFVVHKRGIELDGSHPTLLYGYGGFNHTEEPVFSTNRLAWMRGYGAILAVANLRGGGEYGMAWRDGGSLLQKQNTFDDCQACAQHLADAGFTSPARLTIQGASNGGLLVAACVNQRPDLYACGLAQVGVMDMLRFHKFTIGHAWTTDYGSADDPAFFPLLLSYSPLHNVRTPQGGTRQYPAMLLATADHDDRVVPLHSLKLLAELQHVLLAGPTDDDSATAQRNPLVARIDVRAGHGAGKPTSKQLDEAADLFAFAAKCLGATWKE